jgi:hypothetical protein
MSRVPMCFFLLYVSLGILKAFRSAGNIRYLIVVPAKLDSFSKLMHGIVALWPLTAGLCRTNERPACGKTTWTVGLKDASDFSWSSCSRQIGRCGVNHMMI